MTTFGTQCRGPTCPGGDTVASAQATSSQAFLCRMPVLVPFTSAASGFNYFASQDATLGDVTVHFASTVGAAVGQTFTSPAWGDNVFATVSAVTSTTITFSRGVANYVNSATLALSYIAELQAAGIPFGVVVFNLDGQTNTGSGPILTSPATWRNQMVLTHQAIASTGAPPILYAFENEEDGRGTIVDPGPPPIHSGDTSTIAQYIEKLGIGVDVGQQFGIPVMDSGTTTTGLVFAYWFHLFYEIGTTESRAAADVFSGATLSKNEQQFNIAGRLPTSTNLLGTFGSAEFSGFITNDILTVTQVLSGVVTTGTNAALFGAGVALGTYEPPISQLVLAQLDGVAGGAGHYRVSIPQMVPLTTMTLGSVPPTQRLRIQKVNQLLAAYAHVGTTFVNVHWYQVVPRAWADVIKWMQTIVPLPVVFGEVGIYSQSSVDVVAALSAAEALGAPYAFWWNQQNSPGPGSVALANPDNTLRMSGHAFVNYVTNTKPLLVGQPPLPPASSTPPQPPSPPPPLTPGRLSTNGKNLYLPNGRFFTPRGFNFTNDTDLSSDPATVVSMGGNTVRCLLPFYYDPNGTCASTFPYSSFDAFDPASPATGYLNPTVLATFLAQVNAAIAAGLWPIAGMKGADCDFGTAIDPTTGLYITEMFRQAWVYLAGVLKGISGIAMYEVLSEPRPTNNHYDNTNNAPVITGNPNTSKGPGAAWLFNLVIPSIRAVDPNTIVAFGPAGTYDPRNVEVLWNNIYPVNQYNTTVMSNFYELSGSDTPGPRYGDYVLQLKTFYPGFPNGGSTYLPYPGTYFDTDGARPSAGGSYPGKGKSVTMNSTFLSGLMGVLHSFKLKYQVPVIIDQVGLRTGTPQAYQYISDVLDIANGYGLGWTYWVLRYASPSAIPHGNDQGIIWQDTDHTWHTKNGADPANLILNADGTFGGQSPLNWYALLAAKLTA